MHNNLLFNVPEAINKILENYKIVVVPKDSQPVQLKHGHWEWNDYGGFGNYHCTECGYIPFKYIPCVKFQQKHRPDYMYCPKCGARMDEGEEDDV